jgi:hypothetical protein
MHTGLTLGEMLMLTGRLWLTVIWMTFDVAGLPVLQVAFDVNIQETLSPLDGL